MSSNITIQFRRSSKVKESKSSSFVAYEKNSISNFQHRELLGIAHYSDKELIDLQDGVHLDGKLGRRLNGFYDANGNLTLSSESAVDKTNPSKSILLDTQEGMFFRTGTSTLELKSKDKSHYLSYSSEGENGKKLFDCSNDATIFYNNVKANSTIEFPIPESSIPDPADVSSYKIFAAPEMLEILIPNEKLLNINGGCSVTKTLSVADAVSFDSSLIVSGNTTLKSSLQVDANVKCNSLTISSDKRLKKSIVPLHAALEIVNRLKSVHYEMNGKRSIGFIAQDVKEVLPEFVYEDSDGYMSVNYVQMVAVLSGAIQEMDKKLSALEDRLAKIEKLII